MRASQFFRDLVARVSATHHEHGPVWKRLRRSVSGAVELDDLCTEALLIGGTSGT